METTQNKTSETTQNKTPEATQSKTPEATKSTESFKVTGNWATKSQELKSQYSTLTDSDVKFETGKESELLGRLQTKLGKNREEVIALIKQTETAQA
jgi:uncharacterized protein YjbJ (UPF0337 family)